MRSSIFMLCCLILMVLFNGLIAADIQKECREICEKTRNKKLPKLSPANPVHGYWLCMKTCLQNTLDVEADSKDGGDVIIFGEDEKLPSDLSMPEHIPNIPKDVLKKLGHQIAQESECDDSQTSNNLKETPGSPTDIKAQCEGKEGNQNLVIHWNQPTEGLQYLKGYKVLYKFLSGSDHRLGDYICKVVDKNTTTFVINKSNGLRKGRVALTIMSIPHYKEFSASTHNFEGCVDTTTKVVERNKRSNDADRVTRNSAPLRTEVKVLEAGDSKPPNLTTNPLRIPQPPDGGPSEGKCRNVEVKQSTAPVTAVEKLRVISETPDNGKINVIVQWTKPSDQVGEGFQVFYSKMNRVDYSVDVVNCIEVSKEARGTSFKIPVSEVSKNTVYEVNVAVLPLYSNQNMTFLRFMPFKGKDTKKSEPNVGAIIGGIAAAIAIVAIIGVYMHRSWRKRRRYQGQQDRPNGPMTFFSHCCETDRDINKLLTFAARLQGRYGVPCRIDLLEQRTIETMTEAMWRNKMYTDSRKIVIVVSKRYLEIFKDYVNDPNKDWHANLLRMRVINDMVHIQNHIMTSGYSRKIVCLLLDGVRRNDLPGFLHSRGIFNWPSPDSDDERNFTRHLLDA